MGRVDTAENSTNSFTDNVYTILSDTIKKGTVVIELERQAPLGSHDEESDLTCRKTYSIHSKKPLIDCEYSITNSGDKSIEFVHAVEWNFTLLAPSAPDRAITIEGERFEMNSQGETADLSEWSMTDNYFGFTTHFSTGSEVTLIRYPIETVSNSEGGIESNYQGTSFIALTEFALEPGETSSATFSIELKPA